MSKIIVILVFIACFSVSALAQVNQSNCPKASSENLVRSGNVLMAMSGGESLLSNVNVPSLVDFMTQESLKKLDPRNPNWNQANPLWGRLESEIAKDGTVFMNLIMQKTLSEILPIMQCAYATEMSEANLIEMDGYFKSDIGISHQKFSQKITLAMLENGFLKPEAQPSTSSKLTTESLIILQASLGVASMERIFETMSSQGRDMTGQSMVWNLLMDKLKQIGKPFVESLTATYTAISGFEAFNKSRAMQAHGEKILKVYETSEINMKLGYATMDIAKEYENAETRWKSRYQQALAK